METYLDAKISPSTHKLNVIFGVQVVRVVEASRLDQTKHEDPKKFHAFENVR